MPQHLTITIPIRTWTLLTNANVTAVRAQLQGGHDCQIQASVGEVDPATLSTQGAILLRSGPATAILPDQPLSSLFPGIPGANRLWARCEAEVQISISHG